MPDAATGADPRSRPVLRISLLGMFRVSVGEREVVDTAWRLRKARAVVKLLALAPDHRLHRERLLDQLWPDLPPEAGANNLRYALHVARRTLAGSNAGGVPQPEQGSARTRPAQQTLQQRPTFLKSDAEQVVLYPDGEVWTDVAAFEAKAADARRGDDLARYTAATAEYGGELLPEDRYEDWAAGRREGLRNLYLALLLEQAGLAERAGAGGVAATTLERVLAVDPAHEGAYQALMRVHAQQGQRHLALRQYQQLRQALRRELEAEPDPASQRLYQDILTGTFPPHGARPAAPGAHAAPGVPGGAAVPAGIQETAVTLQLPGRSAGTGAAGAATGGAPAAEPTESPGSSGPLGPPGGDGGDRRHNLPTPITSFVGREQERSEVTRLLDAGLTPVVCGVAQEVMRPRLVTLTGSGGCGKTRLALEVASRLLDAYPDGVWLVELAPLADPDLLVQAVASTLEVREMPGRPALLTLAGALAERRLLLLLDNCEHVLNTCAALADTLLRYCPHLSILATSRQALGMVGEVAYRVPSLPLPDETAAAPVAAGYAAVRLFVERASFGQPSFALSAHNAPAIVQICRRLDGIPLAIELAAARLAVLSPAQLAERLDDRFRLLNRGNRTAPPRHQTLRTLVDWSYDLLDEDERRLFAGLAVFAGGFTLEAAETVCADDERRAVEVLGLLSQLVDKSLVAVGTDRGAIVGGPIEWASGAGSTPTDRSPALSGRRDGQVRYRLPDTLRQYALERLDEDADRGAATRARHAAGFVALAVRAAPALIGPEQGAWLDRLEQEHDNVRAALRWLLGQRDATMALRLGAALGRFWAMRGYLSEGRERLAAVLALAEAAAVPPSAAHVRALCGAGFLAWRQGDAVAARPLLQASVDFGRQVGDASAVGQALFYLGLVPQFQGDYPAARALFEESLTACTAAGDRHSLALALFGLGNLARQEGDDATARTLLERSLDLFREVGDRRSLALPLGYLGRVALRQGDHERARAQLEEALAILQEVGETWLIASLLDSLAEVARYEGDDARAESLLTRCLDLWAELRSTGTQAQGALHQLGHVALNRHDVQRARALFGESLTLARQQGNKRHVAEALAGLAGVAAAADQPAAAARYFGAAEALRRAVGAALSPADQIDHQRAIANARARIGARAFQAAWDAGAQSSPETVVDEAAALEVGSAAAPVR